MFNDYFTKLEKKLIKKVKSSSKGKAKGSDSTKGAKKNSDTKYNELKDSLNNIVPSNLRVDSLKFIDPSGYSPEGVDLIAYKEQFRDICNIMGGYIPSDLVYGTFHITENLNKTNINDILKNVLETKKINRYTENEDQSTVIPAFIISYDTDFKFADLKNIIFDHYTAKSIDHTFEVDIIAILGQGVIVKDWREKRSYIAIETGKDTMMWFFILMNEYLDVEKTEVLDLRNYVKYAEKYNEY